MAIRLLGIWIILILSASSLGWATVPEEAADLTFILRANPIQISHQKQEAIPFNPRESTQIRLFSTGLIRLYQKYISTQDLSVCNFSPSCSRFGMGAIQKYGFFRGTLLTADRLLRDNGIMLHTHYLFDEAIGKYIDPVEAYSQEALTK
jgi:putative component of membrane protein insertase Oxa1/YidC/SpoIIIJ protein YidD